MHTFAECFRLITNSSKYCFFFNFYPYKKSIYMHVFQAKLNLFKKYLQVYYRIGLYTFKVKHFVLTNWYYLLHRYWIGIYFCVSQNKCTDDEFLYLHIAIFLYKLIEKYTKMYTLFFNWKSSLHYRMPTTEIWRYLPSHTRIDIALSSFFN